MNEGFLNATVKLPKITIAMLDTLERWSLVNGSISEKRANWPEGAPVNQIQIFLFIYLQKKRVKKGNCKIFFNKGTSAQAFKN